MTLAKAPLELFPRVLGSSWDSLPEAVRRGHQLELASSATGNFTITHGKSWIARLIARVMGMPRAGIGVRTRVEVRRVDGELHWSRDFGGTRLDTSMYLLEDGRIGERRGLLELCMHVAAADQGVEYRCQDARLCLGRRRVHLPAWLAPRVEGRAWVDPSSGLMRIRIRIGAWMLGTIVAYEGPIEPVR